MQLKITEKKEEKLLSRIAIKAHISFEKATPSKDEVKKVLADALKADESLVVLRKIAMEYGKTEADVDAVVYSSKEEMSKIEPKPKAKKEKKPKAGEAVKPEEKKE